MKQQTVPRATLGRLPEYLQHLKSLDKEVENVSSTTIAKALGLGDVQVRKDLSAVCSTGRPKIGFCVPELIGCLEEALGSGKRSRAVLVGAGKLGMALLGYDEFKSYGISIEAAFDSDSGKLGESVSGKPVFPMEQLEEYCLKNSIRIGIIAVPLAAAQISCNALCKAGVSAIWSFAPGHLSVPQGVALKQENLALSLAHLNMQINNSTQEDNYEKENL